MVGSMSTGRMLEPSQFSFEHIHLLTSKPRSAVDQGPDHYGDFDE